MPLPDKAGEVVTGSGHNPYTAWELREDRVFNFLQNKCLELNLDVSGYRVLSR